MTIYQCKPVCSPIKASVTLPGSKSLTNRALVAASLADGPSLLENILLADDTTLMIEALRDLGIAVTVGAQNKTAELTGCHGSVPADQATIHCGNAGTVMRFCTAISALSRGTIELDGIARMRQRPIGDLAQALETLGTGIEWENEEGFPPIRVFGNGLRGGHVAFQNPESSQLVSALLLVAPYATGDLLIDVTGQVPSRPYLQMTTSVMDQFGVSTIEQFRGESAQFIVPAFQRYQGQTVSIEPDASNATYFLSIPAIVGGSLTVDQLGTGSVQGDARFVDVLESMGCRIDRSADQLTVHGPSQHSQLHGIEIDLNDMPDTVQTLAVLALYADSPTRISNVANLRVKETDRLAALTSELTRLGAGVDERADGLTIHPPEKVQAATICTYDDHRMAMSFSLAGLRTEGIAIEHPECTAKTFPGFFDLLESLA